MAIFNSYVKLPEGMIGKYDEIMRRYRGHSMEYDEILKMQFDGNIIK